MVIAEQDAGQAPGGGKINQQAKVLMAELQNILSSIYADMDVSRAKVGELVRQGRAMAEDSGAWSGGQPEAEEFLSVLESLERKINKTLDLKRLKAEGLVKTVKF